MPVEIRPASREDLPALAGIDAQCPHAAGWNEAAFSAELKKNSALLLAAFDEDVPAGFISGVILPPEAQILNIAVTPRLGRRGTGGALLAAFFEKAAALGCAKATLEVNEHNAPARAFYARAGFTIVGRRPKFYNDSQDALLMDARLPCNGASR